MVRAFSAWRRIARPVIVGTGACATAVVLASSAAAAPAAHQHQPGGRSLQTLFTSVRVFTAASEHAAVKGKVKGNGAAISVLCWTTGMFYKDTTVWYEISAPYPGYVSAFSLAAHFAPAVGVPHCLSPAFREQFNTLEANLRIRTAATTAAAVAGHLGGIGSKVKIDCYVMGMRVLGDPIWYHAVSPAGGYVTGRLLNSGGDPVPGVPHC